MHPDLSPHLHTEECNTLIKKLKECHSVHTLGRFVGYCNEIDNELVKCLRKEREERRQANLAKSRMMQEKYKEKLHSGED